MKVLFVVLGVSSFILGDALCVISLLNDQPKIFIFGFAFVVIGALKMLISLIID